VSLQQSEHGMVAGRVPPSLSTRLLLVSHDRHLAQSDCPADRVEERVDGFVP